MLVSKVKLIMCYDGFIAFILLSYILCFCLKLPSYLLYIVYSKLQRHAVLYIVYSFLLWFAFSLYTSYSHSRDLAQRISHHILDYNWVLQLWALECSNVSSQLSRPWVESLKLLTCLRWQPSIWKRKRPFTIIALGKYSRKWDVSIEHGKYPRRDKAWVWVPERGTYILYEKKCECKIDEEGRNMSWSLIFTKREVYGRERVSTGIARRIYEGSNIKM